MRLWRDGLDILNLVSGQQQEQLETALQGWGFTVLTLDGAAVHDKQSFLQQAGADIANPSVRPPRSWDGLVDYLRSALSAYRGSDVALVWTHADHMLEGGLGDLLKAVACLDLVAQEILSGGSGFATPNRFHVFLSGDGVNFPPRRFE